MIFSLSVVFVLNVISSMSRHCMFSLIIMRWLWGWGISMFCQGS